MILLLRIIKRNDTELQHLVKILEKKFACSVTYTFLSKLDVRLEVRCLKEDETTVWETLQRLS